MRSQAKQVSGSYLSAPGEPFGAQVNIYSDAEERTPNHVESQRKKNEEENKKTKKTEMEKVRREGKEVRNGLGWNIYSC